MHVDELQCADWFTENVQIVPPDIDSIVHAWCLVDQIACTIMCVGVKCVGAVDFGVADRTSGFRVNVTRHFKLHCTGESRNEGGGGVVHH